MKYIIAPINMAEDIINTSCRRKSNDGRILLNENDLKKMPGTLEENTASIEGVIMNETEAIAETNKTEWL